MPGPDDPSFANAATAVTMTPTPATATSTLGVSTPQVLADRYEVIALLGVGGMGRVYRVLDRALDEHVALKMLRKELVDAPGMIERFRSEVKLARKVTSPHVVRTFDLGQHAGEHYLTMELVDGRSLAQRIDDARGALAIDEVLRIARAACGGIAAAHAAGVLHRDLKPDNVLVGNAGGRIAITDFGIARISTGNEVVETNERFVGTPAYMAPEQVDGRHPIAPPTDIYAFGAIIYEMLTGRRPFAGTDAIQVAVARLSAPPPDPRDHRPDTPPALAALVLRCMARDPAARYADGAALGAALASLHETAASATPAPVIAIVPGPTARTVAVFPLRTSVPELADLADGLTEEIIDALTQTRALRVRPLQSIRRVYSPDADPREIGTQLGVDVVVDGSLRKIGELVRITARAIGVADGFQLSADRFDVAPGALLEAGDAVAKAVSRALTVELAPAPAPPRGVPPEATALYLEGKSRTRARWMAGDLRPTIEGLERALVLAPEDPPTMATLALAIAREAFFGRGELKRARELAERVVVLDPADGESWHALAITSLYNGEPVMAGPAFVRAVKRAPGNALAQGGLGSMLLEVGAVHDAIAHLSASLELDPTGAVAAWDLARAHIYDGDWDKGLTVAVDDRQTPAYVDVSLGRFHMWRGERFEGRPVDVALYTTHPDIANYAGFALRFYQTFTLEPADRAMMQMLQQVPSTRLRAARGQFIAEFLLAAGDIATAWEYVESAVAAGLQDYVWLESCPLLAPLRADTARFARVSAPVRTRAEAVLAAMGAAVAAPM